MKGIYFPALLSLSLVVISLAEGDMKHKVLQLGQLAKTMTIPRPLNHSSSASIRANRGIKCEWEGKEKNEKIKEARELTCREIQEIFEEDKYFKKKFQKLCPSGNLDLCAKITISGEVTKGCICSSEVPPKARDNCVTDDDGEGCTCSDKDYCNVGVRSGDVPSILTVTTAILVILGLGLFGPSVL